MAFNETDQYIPGDAGGACFFCASSQRHDGNRPERLFRADRDVEYEGNVVICETCGGELAQKLGWISPIKAAALKAKNTELAKDVKEATRALNVTESLLQAQHEYDEAGLSA